MATILHISDIHRTPDEPVTNDQILHGLLADFDSYEKQRVPAPDLVVISGDLTQNAEPREYDEAAALIDGLLQRLSLSRSRVVLVPGNHDVHWPTSTTSFHPGRRAPPNVPEDLVVPIASMVAFSRDEETYSARLANYRTFYRDFTGTEVSAERDRTFRIREYPELGVAFAEFSSCNVNDHLRFTGQIHPACIMKAASALEHFDGIRVAVWHHDLNWRGEPDADALDFNSLESLSQRVFSLGLCGHTHRATAHNVAHLGTSPLPVVSAGSLCAGKKQRSESLPRLYNVIELRDEEAIVHVRAKDTQTSPWYQYARYYPRDPSEPASWYRVAFPRTAMESRPPSVGMQATGVLTSPRGIAPFAERNAKESRRPELAASYVWTDAALRLNVSATQIVLGPRGCGKTALLLSLTPEGRRGSPAHVLPPESLLERVGLLCTLRANEVTSFNGKGWLDRDDRMAYFSAYIAIVAALEMLGAIETELGPEHPIYSALASVWTAPTTRSERAADLASALRALSVRIVTVAGTRDATRREAAWTAVTAHPIGAGGIAPIDRAASVLSRIPQFSATNWIALFDEAEWLNGWQQSVLYDYFVANPTDRVSTKVATLPYAHRTALGMCSRPLTEGDDYLEMAIGFGSLSTPLVGPQSRSSVGGDEDEHDAPQTGFASLAAALWASRMRAFGISAPPLDQLLPDEDYATVLQRHASFQCPRSVLECRMIDMLPEETRSRAERMRKDDSRRFSDQYWRKYQQPFRFRLAAEIERGGGSMPRYWGVRTVLRACDGNCRWFLALCDQLWTMYWSSGIRPLTAEEQSAAIVQWATALARRTRSLPGSGNDLDEILSRIAARLRHVLHRPFIVAETVSVQVQEFNADQASAIAVAIAWGLLVPRAATRAGDDQPYYPEKDIEMRLGYPIAIAESLPLRVGSVARIGDLRQAAFPWWQD